MTKVVKISPAKKLTKIRPAKKLTKMSPAKKLTKGVKISPAKKRAVARKTVAGEHTASRADEVGKLPYRPKSFTMRALRRAVEIVRRNHPELV